MRRLLLLLLFAAPLHAQRIADCASVPHADHPHARISNGDVDLFVFLPSKTDGYYRGSRFDWSGLIACATYKGHSYFGEWFAKYDPMIADAVVGPAEEFRTEIGYDAAPVGGTFVKVGAGVLRKTSAAPYEFRSAYPIVDTGIWMVHMSRLQIAFEQTLRAPNGIAYRYRKVLSLDAHAPVFRLQHQLTNIGKGDISTQVYDHDFFMIDGQTTGTALKVTLPVAPVFEVQLRSPAKLNGNSIEFERELHAGEIFRGGPFRSGSNYTIRTENLATGAGVLQTSNTPMHHGFFWATDRTVCPEAFLSIHVPAGKTQRWTLRYQLIASP